MSTKEHREIHLLFFSLRSELSQKLQTALTCKTGLYDACLGYIMNHEHYVYYVVMTEVPGWDQGRITSALYISAGKNPAAQNF